MSEQLKKFLTDDVRNILDFIYDAVYVVDTNREIVFWNKAAEKMTGFLKEDVMSKNCGDNILNHIDENGVLVCTENCPLVTAIEHNCSSQRKLFPFHKNGSRLTVSTHINPISDENGKIIGAIEVFRDISNEEKLRIMQEKFEKLIKQYVSESTFDSVKRAVENEDATTAVSKDLTIFFMDIVKFTTMSEKEPAENIVRLLNLFFDTTSLIIKNNLGDIDKFIGDCIMAIFTDANDAVKAAEVIVSQGIPSLNDALKIKGLPQIQVRIGINSGRLIQGDIGSQSRKDLTVIGDVVNTASRVEGTAPVGDFLISESTYSRLEDQEKFVFEKELLLKGKSEPVKLFRIIQKRKS